MNEKPYNGTPPERERLTASKYTVRMTRSWKPTA